MCAYTPVFVLKIKGCGSAGENQGLFIKAATVKALPWEEMFPRRVNATLPQEDRGKLNAPRWGKMIETDEHSHH